MIFTRCCWTAPSTTCSPPFSEHVRRLPQVMECHMVAGGFHYLLKVRMSDMAPYRAFFGDILTAMPGVRETRTYAVPEEVKGTTRLSTRDTIQKLLIGEPRREEEWGTGAIPGDAILATFRATSVASAIDSAMVAHAACGASTLLFKAYERRRASWQGDTLNGVWFDEEPPMDIYVEGLMRANATGGFAMMTFASLQRMSELVRLFLE